MNRKLAILLALMLVLGIAVGAYLAGAISNRKVGDGAHAYQKHGKLEVVCDVVVSHPNEGLVAPFETSRLTLPAVFDLDEATGAYAGEYAISLNRKGTLRVDGDKLLLVRQAMFKRYGLTIQGEHVELDRKTGEFRQWLDLGNEKRLELITGKCRRPDNAPF